MSKSDCFMNKASIHYFSAWKIGVWQQLSNLGWTGQREVPVCMDADLSHPPAVIPKMLRVLEDQRAVEVVVGSRYVEEGGFAGEWNQYRQWNSKISTMLANLVIHDLGVKDPMSGYFCIRKEVYRRAAYIKPIGYKILLSC